MNKNISLIIPKIYIIKSHKNILGNASSREFAIHERSRMIWEPHFHYLA
jgi:hypothetical protein